jgi:hypothetical protein
MEAWTLREFKILEKRLKELDIGYKVVQNGLKYEVAYDNGNNMKIIAMYDLLTGRIKSIE